MKYSDWKISYSQPRLPDALLAAGYSPLIACLLALRGIETPDTAREFLHGGKEQLFDPMLMLDMDKAARRLELCEERNETVAVYGDYDVDGITSTCILTDYLRSRGLNAVPYIPDRIEEGYGLNLAAIDHLKAAGVSLIITVDCGITAVEEAAYAASLGLDMIITDHHECRSQALPAAVAVVDPKREGCPYPNKELAGVGVALKLICAVSGDCAGAVEKYADLAAVGTVADVMVLTGENRYIVKAGLDKIATAPSIGLAALLEQCGMGDKKITATSIGYTLAPRLNAAGRLGKASTAASLLMASDADEAAALAGELCDLNRRRQAIELEIWQGANAMLCNEKPTTPIVLASDDWHQGVIGIAASRLAEQYALPAVMICLDGDKGKGSCRSYGGFNLFEALSACSDYLEGFGGHALAAGLTIKRDKLDGFRRALGEYYIKNAPEETPELICDVLIHDPKLLSMEGVAALDEMEPYGNGNPKPLMCFTDALLTAVIPISNGKHLRMKVEFCGENFDCIYFSCSEDTLGLEESRRIDIAFTPQINEFRGRSSVQLVVSDVRAHDFEGLCSLILAGGEDALWSTVRYCPDRADFIRAWHSIKLLNGSLGDNVSSIIALCPRDMEPERFCVCLMVWHELGLLSSGPEGSIYGGRVNPNSDKVCLENAPLLQGLKKLSSEKDKNHVRIHPC